jgi:N-acetylglucosaminyl-diphospho-decaprenol L-rhamnosyltransferase
VSSAPQTGQIDERVGAVVVDYDAGDVLADCLTSLVAEGVGEIVVVENGDVALARAALARAGHAGVPLISTGRNVGYGAGANRGIAALGPGPFVLVCNPDLHVHPGAVSGLADALESEPSWAIVGPRILTPTGDPYPSARRFPSLGDAAGHALFDQLWKENPFTRRYRAGGWTSLEPTTTDWVSGACFLARRSAVDELGGFDEAYFMFAEDMDLCWRAHQAGWIVGYVPGVAAVRGADDERPAPGAAPARRPRAGPAPGAALQPAGPGRPNGRPRRVGCTRAPCGSVVESRSQSQAKRPT